MRTAPSCPASAAVIRAVWLWLGLGWSAERELCRFGGRFMAGTSPPTLPTYSPVRFGRNL